MKSLFAGRGRGAIAAVTLALLLAVPIALAAEGEGGGKKRGGPRARAGKKEGQDAARPGRGHQPGGPLARLLSDEKLGAVFASLDKDADGKLTAEEFKGLRDALQQLWKDEMAKRRAARDQGPRKPGEKPKGRPGRGHRAKGDDNAGQ